MKTMYISTIKKYKTGDKTVLKDIIDYYEPVIRKYIKRYKKQVWYDDLYQSGLVGLLRGLNSFNADTNNNHFIYLTIWIRGEIMSEIKNNYWMTEEQIKELAAEITAEKFKYDYMLESVMMLDDSDKQIMTMYAYGYTFSEIGEEMKEKEYTVRRRYNKLIKEMR